MFADCSNPVRKVALEEHYLDPSTVNRILADPDLLETVSAGGGVMPEYYEPVMRRLAEFDEHRIADMDKHGIDWAVLSLTAPGVQAIPNADQARAAARTANDFLAEQIAQRPTRYASFAAVALQTRNPPPTNCGDVFGNWDSSARW